MTEKGTLNAVQAKEKALRLLEFRAHSEKELTEKLLRAGANREDLPAIMGFLKEYGLLNDADYAERLAHDLHNIKKLGRHRIYRELKAKGIEADDIESAMLEIPEDENELLLPLMERKLAGNFEKKNIDKAIRYFIYRGYGFDDIKACIESLKSGTFED